MKITFIINTKRRREVSFSAAFSGAASFSKSILLCLPLLKSLLPFSKAIAESSIKLNVNNLGGKLVEFCLNNMNECGERLGVRVTEIAYGFKMLSPAPNAEGTAGFNWKSIQRRLIKLQLGALVLGFRPFQKTTGNRSTQFPFGFNYESFSSLSELVLRWFLIVFFFFESKSSSSGAVRLS